MAFFAAPGDGVDGQPGASHAGGHQRLMQRAGQRAPGERRGIHPLDRRIAVQHGLEFGRGFPPGGRPFGLAAGQPVRGHPVGAEPGSHVAARQRGELPDGANPHPPQQVRQLFSAGAGQARLGGELADGQRRQKPRVASRLDDTAGSRREDRGGQLVGDPDLTLGAGGGHRIDQPFGGGGLGPEIAGRPAHRQHQQPGPQHLGAGHQLVHRRDHRFEEAGVAVRVGGGDMQVRAPGRRLPAPQPPPHPHRPGGRRAGDHPVGQRDRDRDGGGQIRGRGRRDRGPIHAPNRQNP